MNIYEVTWEADGTKHALTDALAAQRLCRTIGYLWLTSKRITLHSCVAENVPHYKRATGMSFYSSNRLPSQLDTSLDSSVAMDSVMLQLLSEDSACNDRASNLDQAVVVQGSLIVAVSYKDISNELSSEVRYWMGTDVQGPLYLWIGIANTTAQQGVYQTPFSTALAYATLGRPVAQVPVMLANNS